jgi:2-oxoglutarate dehydrogenase E1 component
MDKYSYIANAHGNYIDELYEAYKKDPQLVDLSWQKFFEGFEFSQQSYAALPGQKPSSNGNPSPVADKPAAAAPAVGGGNAKELNVSQLIHAYRSRGHLRSNTNPVRQRRDHKAYLDITDFGLTEADMDREFDAGKEIGIGRASLRKIVEALRYIYLGTVGFEYMYIRNADMLEWFKKKAEQEALNFDPSLDEKKQILKKLNEAVVFENFLHTKYLGQKRFSLEGGESTIAALDAAINHGASLGVKEVMIGMAHRGRLNVLANIMGKTYGQIFTEFEGTADPDLTMGDGDVKYHMGYSSQVDTPSGNQVNLKLAPNPSHLEAVNPVVEGFLRAKAEFEYNDDLNSVLPILIHGDAAIAGQGIMYEVAQMSNLKAYNTGGTIHFVINNQVGFTTDYDDARSSIYSTDVAKVTDAPVLHVNGDDPEAVVFCMKLAVEYRQKFNNDIFIDMVCYRRHGHNESDEPKFTQPQLYAKISKHANPREVYNKHLIEKGEVDADLARKMDAEFKQLLQDRLDLVKQKPLPYQYQELEKAWQNLRRSNPEDFEQSPETGVDMKQLEKVAKALVRVPEGFKPIKQIEKTLKQRNEMFFKTKELNWAAAELLAYGSLLLEDKIVRLVGQDVERGTFSHRHSVLHDAKTNEAYNSLNHIDGATEQFRVYNSLLSEYGAMGFEFGYAMANPHALVIWEAQFGDFANGAQVMIDQFVTPSETKWQRMNGMVMLLPHGYEGQGPEHSNARPERFLQLSAEYNIIVANVTEPSNFFHLLRRQLAWPFRKPLVVMSPKSLLRHPRVVSPMEELTKGRFREVLPDTYADKKKVKRVLLCTGKVYYDLLEEQGKEKRKDVAIIRVEQLHPFPEKQIEAQLAEYGSDVEVYWVQEEPKNMGYWAFVLRTYESRRLKIIARKESASPATGYNKVHGKEQAEIIKKAFDL